MPLLLSCSLTHIGDALTSGDALRCGPGHTEMLLLRSADPVVKASDIRLLVKHCVTFVHGDRYPFPVLLQGSCEFLWLKTQFTYVSSFSFSFAPTFVGSRRVRFWALKDLAHGSLRHPELCNRKCIARLQARVMSWKAPRDTSWSPSGFI